MPRPKLEFWFEFASTYSYLSAMRIDAAAAKAGVTVIWRPFLLGPIFAAQGWRDSPFNIYPAKGRYMWADMARQAARYGVPFQKPAVFPQHSVLAARIAHLALSRPEGRDFCRAVFAAQFGRGADISNPALLTDLLEQTGLPPTLIEAAGDPKTKAALRAAVAEAETKGIFGAPSFVADDTLFWGDDRLEHALDAAKAAQGLV